VIHFGKIFRTGAIAAGAVCAFLLIASTVPGCMRSTMRPGREETGAGGKRLPPFIDTTLSGIRTADDSVKLRKLLASYLGTPYRLGGMSKDGVDCSGLACLVYREIWNVNLPRSAVDMIRIGATVPIAKARPGDLIFFRWSRFGGVDHVGIYTIEGRFVHASKTLGVIESTLEDDYYLSHLIGARRVLL